MRSGKRIGFLWTQETIIYAIELFHRQHLCIPTLEEWAKAGENHPSYVTVMRRFGSWNNALRAAGPQRRDPGHRRRQPFRARCPHGGRFIPSTAADPQP